MPKLEGLGSYLATLGRKLIILLGGGSVLMIGMGVFEHYTQITVPWWTYLSVVGFCVGVSLFTVGFEKHQRLLPRLTISNATPQTWLDSLTDVPCRAFYFEVVNDNEGTSIEEVTVKLTRIDPPQKNLDWLPVPLFIKHENEKPYPKSFTLN